MLFGEFLGFDLGAHAFEEVHAVLIIDHGGGDEGGADEGVGKDADGDSQGTDDKTAPDEGQALIEKDGESDERKGVPEKDAEKESASAHGFAEANGANCHDGRDEKEIDKEPKDADAGKKGKERAELGAVEQGNDSQDSKPNPIREHRSILLRRLQV